MIKSNKYIAIATKGTEGTNISQKIHRIVIIVFSSSLLNYILISKAIYFCSPRVIRFYRIIELNKNGGAGVLPSPAPVNICVGYFSVLLVRHFRAEVTQWFVLRTPSLPPTLLSLVGGIGFEPMPTSSSTVANASVNT